MGRQTPSILKEIWVSSKPNTTMICHYIPIRMTKQNTKILIIPGADDGTEQWEILYVADRNTNGTVTHC